MFWRVRKEILKRLLNLSVIIDIALDWLLIFGLSVLLSFLLIFRLSVLLGLSLLLRLSVLLWLRLWCRLLLYGRCLLCLWLLLLIALIGVSGEEKPEAAQECLQTQVLLVRFPLCIKLNFVQASGAKVNDSCSTCAVNRKAAPSSVSSNPLRDGYVVYLRETSISARKFSSVIQRRYSDNHLSCGYRHGARAHIRSSVSSTVLINDMRFEPPLLYMLLAAMSFYYARVTDGLSNPNTPYSIKVFTLVAMHS